MVAVQTPEHTDLVALVMAGLAEARHGTVGRLAELHDKVKQASGALQEAWRRRLAESEGLSHDERQEVIEQLCRESGQAKKLIDGLRDMLR